MAVCRICTHRQRDRIEFELGLGHTDREIAARWRLPLSWVLKHRRKHYTAPVGTVPASGPGAPEEAGP